MVSAIISALMLTLVAVLLTLRRAKREQSITYAALAIAASMLMSNDDLYVIVDGWFGANDLIHLATAITLMVGVFYLARGVARVGDLALLTSRILLGAPALIAATAVVSGAFFLIRHHGGTSVTFMLDYGDQPAAAVYSGAQFVYLAGVLTALMLIAIRQIRTGTRSAQVVSILLAAGSAVGLVLALDIIAMDVAHVAGWENTLTLLQAPYSVLQVATFAPLCVGLAVAPISQWALEVRRGKLTRVHTQRITSLWQAATRARPSLAKAMGREDADAESMLHRKLVEIRDAALDSRNTFTLHREDRALLAQAEGHLLSRRA